MPCETPRDSMCWFGHLVVGDADPGLQQHAAVADHAVRPAVHLAVLVERRLQALERLRPEHAVAEVFLARPDQLHRPLRLARDARRLGGVVAERAAAEAAAHVALVQRDLLGLEAERLRHRRARAAGVLRAFPDLDTVAGRVEARHRVQRLHLRVVAVVAEVLGLVGLRGRAESALRVALGIERLGLRVGIRMHLQVVLGLQTRL